LPLRAPRATTCWREASGRTTFAASAATTPSPGSPATTRSTGATATTLWTAGTANDVLDSGTGADTLHGRATGDDRLIVASGTAGELDVADGGAGTDRLEADFAAAGSAVTLTLAAGAGGGLDGWLGTSAGHTLDFTGIEQLDLSLSAFRRRGNRQRPWPMPCAAWAATTCWPGAGRGDDVLDGGAGADRMIGGAGNDRYVVDNAADSILEEKSAGTDGVTTTLDRYALGRNIENLTGSAADQHLTGNALTNIILGGDGNDRLEDRLGGMDTLDGGAGDDSLYAERPVGSPESRPTLIGGAGNDEIRIKGGGATINAGDGDDRVILEQAAASVTLGAGKDVLKLSAGSTASVYDFNAGLDRLDFHALLGTNLDGWDQTANPFTTNLASVESYYNGLYAEVLYKSGSGFNDFTSFLYFDKMRFSQFTDSALGGFTQETTAAATTVTGTEAGETLYGTAGDNLIEGLGGADRIEGGFGADTLRGGEGDDYLNGQTGHDTLFGGAGNDHLVDDAGGGDTLNGDGGNDLIEAVRAYKMVKRTLNLNGGEGDDEIAYTQLTDRYGQAGTGFAVDIDAGEGADLVRLGARSGTTTVTLGAGADTLRLAPETGGTINVTDFQAGAGGDRIDLTAYLTAKLGNWNQADNPFATGYLALTAVSATEVALKVDMNGGGDSFVLLATLKGTDPLAFTAENFLGFDPGGAAVASGPGFAGTAGDDVAAGTAGADSLTGLAGDDRLSGGLGADVLDGGDGHDRLSGGGGDDLLTGGEGDDLIEDLDGGNDRLSGGGGDDWIVITRAAAGTPGAAVFAAGGEGVDRFDVTSWSAASLTLDGGAGGDEFNITSWGTGSLTLDGGAGEDRFNFFKLGGSARVTLGDGRDVIRLDPAYFGPHTNQTRVKEIAVTDFQAGPGGDFVDLKEALAFGAMHWPDDGEGFRNGTLRIRQDGADTLVQYTYSSSGDYQTLLRFEGKQVAEFTRDNFGLDLPSTLILDQAGGKVANADDIFGVPAVRITGADVQFTNLLGGSVEGIGFFTPGGTTISIEASGATIVNRGAIRGNIEGSAFADRIENFGTILGKVNLGAGNDSYFERFTGAVHSGTNVDLGGGDDSAEIELTGNSLGLSLIGGTGYDTLTIRNIVAKTNVSTYVSFSTAGFEQLNLHGIAGASIDFGGRPAVEDIHVYGGLTLNVPNRPNGTTPYTLAPAGNLHLHGSNLTAGLNWSFKTITGSDLAEKVELTSSATLVAGTAARPVESISLGGGDDYLRWGGRQAQPGSADGGEGRDWLSVDLLAAVQDLSVFTGFETIEINNYFLNGSAPVRKISGIGAVTERLLFTPSVSIQPPAMAFELEGVLPGLAVGAGQAKLTLLAGTTIASLSDRYLIDSTTPNASPQQIENRGSILGAVALGGGNDSFANFGAVGGSVDLGDGNDLFTGHFGGNVAGLVRGGGGNDTYVIDGAAYVVEEAAGEGTDEVRTGLAVYRLGANVENLTGTSSAGQDLRGNSSDNAVTGGSGNDVLRLQDGGDDTVLAGAGNDTLFFIGSLTAADVVNGGDGVDTLVLQGPYGSLALTANVTQIENISILGGGNTGFGEPGTNRHDYVLTTHDANFAAGCRPGSTLRPCWRRRISPLTARRRPTRASSSTAAGARTPCSAATAPTSSSSPRAASRAATPSTAVPAMTACSFAATTRSTSPLRAIPASSPASTI
jgi:Ca2+-binding RTX toxin-like protein